eukprot:gb/GEZN01001693.1/.p1 GENE.gb/GEZN01001693.1/~~gb/GEZN01001693.1/.p1  ORF type:complete len:600 (+),score=58.60 gb/GEZN01001693.1/:381-2180(+)
MLAFQARVPPGRRNVTRNTRPRLPPTTTNDHRFIAFKAEVALPRPDPIAVVRRLLLVPDLRQKFISEASRLVREDIYKIVISPYIGRYKQLEDATKFSWAYLIEHLPRNEDTDFLWPVLHKALVNQRDPRLLIDPAVKTGPGLADVIMTLAALRSEDVTYMKTVQSFFLYSNGLNCFAQAALSGLGRCLPPQSAAKVRAEAAKEIAVVDVAKTVLHMIHDEVLGDEEYKSSAKPRGSTAESVSANTRSKVRMEARELLLHVLETHLDASDDEDLKDRETSDESGTDEDAEDAVPVRSDEDESTDSDIPLVQQKRRNIGKAADTNVVPTQECTSECRPRAATGFATLSSAGKTNRHSNRKRKQTEKAALLNETGTATRSVKKRKGGAGTTSASSNNASNSSSSSISSSSTSSSSSSSSSRTVRAGTTSSISNISSGSSSQSHAVPSVSTGRTTMVTTSTAATSTTASVTSASAASTSSSASARRCPLFLMHQTRGCNEECFKCDDDQIKYDHVGLFGGEVRDVCVAFDNVDLSNKSGFYGLKKHVSGRRTRDFGSEDKHWTATSIVLRRFLNLIWMTRTHNIIWMISMVEVTKLFWGRMA